MLMWVIGKYGQLRIKVFVLQLYCLEFILQYQLMCTDVHCYKVRTTQMRYIWKNAACIDTSVKRDFGVLVVTITAEL